MVRELEFGDVTRKADVRLAKDMKEVIIDKDWLEGNEDTGLYYMYRDLWKEGDKETIKEENLRYDITVIPPRDLGKEFVKTKGHYHPNVVSGVSYPEIYEVLDGEAHYLLKKKSSDGVEDVVLMKAEEGDKALIPPNYGHITINPGDSELKMANWVDRTFDSIYQDILELEGGAYYELKTGEWVKNENYDNVPEMREVESTVIPELGIEKGKNMYSLIRENPENLDFLKRPQEFESLFQL